MDTEASLRFRPFQRTDETAVVRLWQCCGLVHPQNNPQKDISRKLSIQPDLFLLAILEDRIIGSVMVGYEGHRGWINYLAVDPAHQRRGVGRELMAEAERVLIALGCPKINLQVRASNQAVLSFYRAIGFKVDDVVSLGKRLEAD